MIKGIDISAYQNSIDFNMFKNSGGDFVIIRAGFGTTVSQKDKRFDAHISCAIRAGLKIGVYWFIYAKNIIDAKKNADACAQIIAPYKNNISPIIWADFEYDSERYAQSCGWVPSPANREELIKSFLDRIEEYGYSRGLYTNPDYLKSRYSKNLISNCRVDYFWLASYTNNKPDNYQCDIWQYSSRGKIAGYNGNIDVDYCYKDSIFDNDFSGAPSMLPENDPEVIPETNSAVRYTVKKGDTLSAIALKYNTSYMRIAKDNGLTNPNLIYPGQELIILT